MSGQVVRFGNNVTALLLSWEADRVESWASVTLTGQPRVDLQRIGKGEVRITATIKTENEDAMQGILEQFLNGWRVPLYFNEPLHYYVTLARYDRRLPMAGQISDPYIARLELIADDPVIYGASDSKAINMSGYAGSDTLAVNGSMPTLASVILQCYEYDAIEHQHNGTAGTLAFGMKDDVGVSHLRYVKLAYIPGGWCFWDSRYNEPPLPPKPGNVSWIICSEQCAAEPGNPTYNKTDRWGLEPSPNGFSPEVIEAVYAPDERGAKILGYWSGRPIYLKEVPEKQRCEWDARDYWTSIYGIAFEANLHNSTFLRMEVETDIRVPFEYHGEQPVLGAHCYIWNNSNMTWQQLDDVDDGITMETTPPSSFNYSFDASNWSSAWLIDGKAYFLFEKCTRANCSGGSPPDVRMGAYEYNSNDAYGVQYVRVRVYRDKHRYAVILPRQKGYFRYAIVHGRNNVPNATIAIGLHYASAEGIAESPLVERYIAGDSWNGTHCISLFSFDVPENLSYWGISIRLKDEVYDEGSLPELDLFNMTDATLLAVHGDVVTLPTPSGNKTDKAFWTETIGSNKGFLCGYAELDVEGSVELYNHDMSERIWRLSGFLCGEYKFTTHQGWLYHFSLSDGLDAYIEADGISSIALPLNLGDGHVVYAIDLGAQPLDKGYIYYEGNVSAILIGEDWDSLDAVHHWANATSVFTPPGRRFLLWIEGGTLDVFDMWVPLEESLNPLPPLFLGGNIIEWSKSTTLNVTAVLSWEEAYPHE